jgi:hypothetical protein
MAPPRRSLDQRPLPPVHVVGRLPLRRQDAAALRAGGERPRKKFPGKKLKKRFRPKKLSFLEVLFIPQAIVMIHTRSLMCTRLLSSFFILPSSMANETML